jgi:hypothetical protein
LGSATLRYKHSAVQCMRSVSQYSGSAGGGGVWLHLFRSGRVCVRFAALRWLAGCLQVEPLSRQDLNVLVGDRPHQGIALDVPPLRLRTLREPVAPSPAPSPPEPWLWFDPVPGAEGSPQRPTVVLALDEVAAGCMGVLTASRPPPAHVCRAGVGCAGATRPLPPPPSSSSLPAACLLAMLAAVGGGPAQHGRHVAHGSGAGTCSNATRMCLGCCARPRVCACGGGGGRCSHCQPARVALPSCPAYPRAASPPPAGALDAALARLPAPSVCFASACRLCRDPRRAAHTW